MTATKGAGQRARPSGGKHGRTIPKSTQPIAPEAITTDDVARAFNAARVAVPPAERLTDLAATFTLYKTVFLDAQRDRILNEAATAAGDAVRVLRQTLPILFEHYQTRKLAGDAISGWQADAVADLGRAVLAADLSRIEHQANTPDVVKDWRWFAAVIRDVVAPAFPNARGTAKGGPVTRFLAEIIPLVSGDAPTPKAIGTAINKRQTGEK